MTHFHIYLSFYRIAWASISLFITTTCYGASQLSLDQNGIDLGTINLREQAETIERVVTISNLGTDPLNILHVQAGCGCIRAALLDGENIKPQEKTRVRVTLDPKSINRGKHTYQLQIYSDDPTTPLKEIPINYTFKPDVWLSNQDIALESSDRRGEFAASGTIQIVDQWSESLKIMSVASSSPYVCHEVTEVRYSDLNGKQVHYFMINAILLSSAPLGTFDETLTVSTNHPIQTKLDIPIHGNLRGPVRINPPVILLQEAHPDNLIKRRLRLVSSPTVSIGTIQVPPGWKTTVSRHDDGRQADIEVMGSSEGLKVNSRGEIEGNAISIEILEPRHYVEVVNITGSIAK